MYTNQLIISFVVFGALYYLMSIKKDDDNHNNTNKKEDFNNNHVSYYNDPNHPNNMYQNYGYYYQYPNKYPQHINKNFNYPNGPFKSFDQIKNSEHFDPNEGEFSPETKYDNDLSPKVGKGDKKIVKFFFFLMLGGVAFLLYEKYKNNDTNL